MENTTASHASRPCVAGVLSAPVDVSARVTGSVDGYLNARLPAGAAMGTVRTLVTAR